MQHIIANWKSNGNQQSIADWCHILATNIQPMAERRFTICPPSIYLSVFQSLLAEVLQQDAFSLGGQDISSYPAGAHTGEIHGGMLTDMECRYVLIGHSERRQLFNEGDEMVYAKLKQAHHHGLIPVFCIGETQEEHQREETDKVLKQQLNPILRSFKAHQDVVKAPIIAYEPVWAIGTGLAASPQLVNETHITIKQHLADSTKQALAILYGGSVKANNASEFIQQPSVDGLLVGGASLDAGEILKIYSVG